MYNLSSAQMHRDEEHNRQGVDSLMGEADTQPIKT